MDNRILILDTETTNQTTPKIVDVAWVEVDENLKIIDEFESLVDPEEPISFASSGIHGIVDADVADAPTIEELFTLVLPEPPKDIILIAHNSAFDFDRVKDCLDIAAQFCTLRAVRRLYPDLENHQLSTLKYALNLRKDQTAHRAMADVLVTYDLMVRMVADFGGSLLEFIKEFEKPFLLEKISFGKHQGEKFADVPSGYLKWILGANFDVDTVFTAETVLKARGQL